MIEVGLKIALALVGVFVRRSEKKRQIQKEMMDLANKHNEAVMGNVRLRKQYRDLLKQINKDKGSKDA